MNAIEKYETACKALDSEMMTIGDFEKEIAPLRDVVPVVHGEWEYIDDTYCGFEDTDVRCSVCKTITNIKRFRKTKWCPDCGALMDC